MKILWVKTDFLHPTTRGGQIRTLEMVKRLNQKHVLHYIAFDDLEQPEGPRRAKEYSAAHYSIPHSAPEKKLTSPAFLAQLIAGALSPLPVAINRWRSVSMKREIERLQRTEQYDAIVCDFLFSAPNIPDLSQAIIFQHNVEAVIWQRHVEHSSNIVKKLYFQLQAQRMAQYEGEACRKAKRVIAVSEADANTMRRQYRVQNVSSVPTGVDLEYCKRPSKGPTPAKSDLVFVGSMDWMPNSDGIRWFVREVFPLIVKKRPQTTFNIVGRKPPADIDAMISERIKVTGTVPDVRPYLWGSKVSVVPLRIGGGTRLKIYEAMAASLPVVSTQIGAEGLEIEDGRNIAIADDAARFADRCVELLNDPDACRLMASRALEIVTERYSWEVVTAQFERLLE
jgi:glycosyltransferase involved in cell wall biosynthesis